MSSSTDEENCVLTEMVLVPHAALAHVIDWHDDKCCGIAHESMHEAIFGWLRDADNEPTPGPSDG